MNRIEPSIDRAIRLRLLGGRGVKRVAAELEVAITTVRKRKQDMAAVLAGRQCGCGKHLGHVGGCRGRKHQMRSGCA